MPESILYTSKHFEIQSITKDISAVIATSGGHAICNAGVIDLGGQLLIYDTFVTPEAARDLKQFIDNRFGKIPQLVINSHYHNDHIWGNQVFSPIAPILSSTRTRELISTSGKEELEWYSSRSAQKLASLHAQYESENDENQRRQLLLLIGEYEGIVEALPELKVCLPCVTFESCLNIHGTRHTAELITYERAHTGSDTILYLPNDGIVFMSDVLFVGFHPYLGDGDPISLLKALQSSDQLEAACYVPGHGPLGTRENVRLLIEYIESCMDTARGLVKSGQFSKDKIEQLKIPKLFQAWDITQFYAVNIDFLCQYLMGKTGNK